MLNITRHLVLQGITCICMLYLFLIYLLRDPAISIKKVRRLFLEIELSPSSSYRRTLLILKKIVLVSVLAFVFNRPYAQVIIDASGGTTGGAISSPISNSVSSVGNTTTGASTSSSQGGTGGLGGSSTSSGGSSNAVGGRSSSSGNTSGNSSVVSNYAAPKIPVSTAYSPTNFPTAPCMGATSLGASGVMFGLSAGSSWEATECMRLELARSFEQSGHIEDAQAVRCSSKYAVDAPSCIRLRQEKVNGNKQAVPILEPQVLPVDSQRPQSTKFIEGAYFETIDPETGFQTIIDTRDFYRRIATP